MCNNFRQLSRKKIKLTLQSPTLTASTCPHKVPNRSKTCLYRTQLWAQLKRYHPAPLKSANPWIHVNPADVGMQYKPCSHSAIGL